MWRNFERFSIKGQRYLYINTGTWGWQYNPLSVVRRKTQKGMDRNLPVASSSSVRSPCVCVSVRRRRMNTLCYYIMTRWHGPRQWPRGRWNGRTKQWDRSLQTELVRTESIHTCTFLETLLSVRLWEETEEVLYKHTIHTHIGIYIYILYTDALIRPSPLRPVTATVVAMTLFTGAKHSWSSRAYILFLDFYHYTAHAYSRYIMHINPGLTITRLRVSFLKRIPWKYVNRPRYEYNIHRYWLSDT